MSKLIDEKGKVFGIINVIDLSIIIVLVLALAFFAINAISNKPLIDNVDDANMEYTVVVLCPLQPVAVANMLKPGDLIVYGNKYENGEILSVTYEDAKVETVDAQGELHIVTHPTLKDLHVSIKVINERTDGLIFLGDYQMNLGKSMFVKTNRVEIIGTVENIIE